MRILLATDGSNDALGAVTVGIDGSEHARRAVEWLASLPLPAALRVRLVGVAERQHYPSTAPAILRDALRTAVATVEGERRATLEHAIGDVARCLSERATVEIEVATGAPAEVLVRDAERNASDLIVVGARGAGALTRLLLGSVSESVLRHAECPVLVVRAGGAS